MYYFFQDRERLYHFIFFKRGKAHSQGNGSDDNQVSYKIKGGSAAHFSDRKLLRIDVGVTEKRATLRSELYYALNSFD
jgi:hypothetical protein